MNAFGFATSIVLAAVTSASAAPSHWIATSTTAIGITGDVTVTAASIEMDGKTFVLSHPQTLRGRQIANAAQVVSATVTPATTATLYRTDIAGKVRLLSGNRLCGPDTGTTWMLFVREPATTQKASLSIATFAGNAPPNLDPQVVATSKSLCGTFLYEAP